MQHDRRNDRVHRAVGRAVALAAAALVAVTAPFAQADTGLPGAQAGAFVPAPLLAKAAAAPAAKFKVIVAGTTPTARTAPTDRVGTATWESPTFASAIRRIYTSINGVAAELSGAQVLELSRRPDVFSITPDVPVRVAGYSSRQQWPYASGLPKYWASATATGLRAPAIAFVDSGVDASRADFGGRVVKSVRLTSLLPNAPGDGRGHGTFVAGVAAGEATGYAGAVPNANIVSIDVVNDSGTALTSDVIAAVDWILANKATYGIRVANFSLHTAVPTSILYDPLNRAVERLWLSGVVVVTAAGNYGATQAGVPYAPGNDPFVITVGAADIAGTVTTLNDFGAPWSAYGYTPDGFLKPDLVAPGRYMVGPVPPLSTLAVERPDRIVAPGYLQMSGTSFAAPVVSGAAAYLLALHPEWTPDQVKGALLVSARALPAAVPGSFGVGELDAAAAAAVAYPPNPNHALNAFLVRDADGGTVPVFDAATWSSVARVDATWDSATWDSATWDSATWSSATWSSATWSSATWDSATWSSATWDSATWSSYSYSDATWSSNAEAEGLLAGGYWITPEEELAVAAELGLTP